MAPLEDDLERRLLNWARWKDGGSESVRISSVGRFGDGGFEFGTGSGGYREARMPVIAAEAMETDRAVETLELDRRNALRGWYLGRLPVTPWYMVQPWTQEDLARALGFALRTFQRLLALGRLDVASALIARRTKSAA